MYPREFAVAPYDKEPLKKHQVEKEKLIKESEKVFDDIELYGLVATNDLLKISRIQQKISKSDFSNEFIEFRKRIYKTIEKTGDQIKDVIKKMREEFNNVKLAINDNMRRKLRRNKAPSNLIDENFKELKDKLNTGVSNTENYVNNNCEKIKTILFFLQPPKIEIELDESKKKVIDWNKRLQRRRRIKVLRKFIDTYYEQRLNEQNDINETLENELAQKDRERYEARKKYELRKQRLERERKERQLQKRRAEKELKAKIILEQMRLESEHLQTAHFAQEEKEEEVEEKKEEVEEKEEEVEEKEEEVEEKEEDSEPTIKQEERKKDEEKESQKSLQVDVPNVPDDGNTTNKVPDVINVPENDNENKDEEPKNDEDKDINENKKTTSPKKSKKEKTDKKKTKKSKNPEKNQKNDKTQESSGKNGDGKEEKKIKKAKQKTSENNK